MHISIIKHSDVFFYYCIFMQAVSIEQVLTIQLKKG